MVDKELAQEILAQLHESSHWGTQALRDHFLRVLRCIGIYTVAKQITATV